ncbi:MAG: EFR1 family ferrodoxin [Bacteroidales bacterium]|nr:EFR1 family ferrodoxin [Bacteroidales bacterium]
MKCLLIYFTGTFNTRYVSRRLKEKMEAAGYEVDLYEIDPLKTERLDFSGYDLVGLGYPIYGYNAPWPFLKFIRKQKFPKGIRTFIYKNSGETEKVNDASSLFVWRKLKRSGAIIENEYHFLMPYNIHFRFDERLVKEILMMDEKLYDILVHEVTHCIPNIKRYKLWHKIVTRAVSIQFIGGDVNSFLYSVDEDKCSHCDLCIKRCPTQNIFRDKDGKMHFHHHCLMCMRCSFFCPTNAINIGFLQQWGWKVNGGYDFEKIKKIELTEPFITKDTQGFFHCYIESYENINRRYQELFGD